MIGLVVNNYQRGKHFTQNFNCNFESRFSNPFMPLQPHLLSALPCRQMNATLSNHRQLDYWFNSMYITSYYRLLVTIKFLSQRVCNAESVFIHCCPHGKQNCKQYIVGSSVLWILWWEKWYWIYIWYSVTSNKVLMLRYDVWSPCNVVNFLIKYS